MNLFIDTNIYLTFYHFTGDDLEELKKLSVAIKGGRVVLYVPEQVIWEYKRNREVKISDALKKLNEQKLPDQFPQICKEYKEFKTLQESTKNFIEAKTEIMNKLNHDIESNSLKADQIISDLFSKAKKIKVNDKLLTLARKRVELGNPPGKKNDYGDAINWEALIVFLPDKEDLYLITDDKDYISQTNENNLTQFLLEEWKEKKKSNIFFYRRLSNFFGDKFPEIKLASELEKEIAISELISSGSFQNTHLAISKLSKFTEFSNDQINKIIEASIINNQISWIKDDVDVKNFLSNLIKDRESIIDSEKLKKFNEIYNYQTGGR